MDSKRTEQIEATFVASQFLLGVWPCAAVNGPVVFNCSRFRISLCLIFWVLAISEFFSMSAIEWFVELFRYIILTYARVNKYRLNMIIFSVLPI